MISCQQTFKSQNQLKNNEQKAKQIQEKQQSKIKYEQFKKWFSQNGGLSIDINFPTYFQPTNYIGISATKQIPPNKVILAIPKQMIISLQKVHNSQLKDIIYKYQIFNDQQNDDYQYNLLVLYLIMQKMKGKQSFFYNYISVIQLSNPQTIMDWNNQQIQTINDPYLNNIRFIKSLRKQFQPIFKIFKEISQKQENRKIFPEIITKQLFNKFYAAVMTRGFGWGLPQTMLVPYADFLNHSSTGVHHYVFDKQLEGYIENSNRKSQQYVIKKFQLNLIIFPEIDNLKLLPVTYQMNDRQKYIIQHLDQLQRMNLINKIQKQKLAKTRMDPHITNSLYNLLISQKIEKYDLQQEFLLSSDSQDNDSQSDQDLDQPQRQYKNKNEEQSIIQDQDEIINQIQKINQNIVIQKSKIHKKQKQYLKWVFKQTDRFMGQRFSQPKPMVNVQFQDDVKFDWWFENKYNINKKLQKQNYKQDQEKQNIIKMNKQNQTDQIKKFNKVQLQQKYFIVSTSHKIYPYQQIFNCYGRRSNRFLLMWYGFCFQNNKYDSVPFRIWSQQVSKKTGQYIYTKYLTQIQWLHGIPLGNYRFSIHQLSNEFRLKKKSINYQLLSFLRYNYLKEHKQLQQIYKIKQLHVHRISLIQMQIDIFLTYQKYLNQLYNVFFVEKIKIKEKEAEKKNIQGVFQKRQYRNYFKEILQKSNKQILENHMISTKLIIKALLQIQDYLKLIHYSNQIDQHKIQGKQQDRLKKQKKKQKYKNYSQVQISKIKIKQIYQKRFYHLINQEYDRRFTKNNLNGKVSNNQQQNQEQTFQSESKNQKLQQLKDIHIRLLKLMVRNYFKQLIKIKLILFK